MKELDFFITLLIIGLFFAVFMIGKECTQLEVKKEFAYYPAKNVMKAHGWESHE